jgi:hypothetical protein
MRHALRYAVITAGLACVTTAFGQQVLNNTTDGEQMYISSSDQEGNVTTQYFVSSKGKAYIQNGKIAFGTEHHRLKNVNGKGSEIVIMPNQLDRAAMNLIWVLTIRVDEMKFRWALDEEHGGEMTIAVDAFTPHNKNVTSGGISKDDDPSPKYDEHSVATKDILLNGSWIVLSDVSGIPYTPGRTYLNENKSATNSGQNVSVPAISMSSSEDKLTIAADGTLAHQDIIVHLTSPLQGDSETLLRKVTLENQYKDDLMFLEMRGVAGERTSIVYFNKGQSVSFDSSGNPVAGSGKFEIDPTTQGQPIVGWLNSTSLRGQAKLMSKATFEFTDTSGPAKWKFVGAVVGAGVVIAGLIFYTLNRRKPVRGS